MERDLSINLRWSADGTGIEITVIEPESGDVVVVRECDCRSESDFLDRVQYEVCGWIEMMRDEAYMLPEIRKKFDNLLVNGKLAQYAAVATIDEMKTHLVEMAELWDNYYTMRKTQDEVLEDVIFGVLDSWYI